MGAADGLRDTVASCALQNNVHGTLKACPVALGDKDRFHTVLCSQNGADLLSIVDKGSTLSPPRARFLESADEPGLGAPYGGKIKDEPHVGRQAEPSRVRNPLTVKQNHIGSPSKLVKSMQQ